MCLKNPGLRTRRKLLLWPSSLPSPFFQGFRGHVEVTERGITTRGVMERPNPRLLVVTELPIGRWTEPFLTELKALAEGTKQQKGLHVVSVVNMSTEYSVRIEITLGEESAELEDQQLEKALKLSTSLPTTFMYAFDGTYSLRLFSTAVDILREHARMRLDLYAKRRAHQLADMEQRLHLLDARVRFVQLVIDGNRLRAVLHGGPSPLPGQDSTLGGDPVAFSTIAST